MCAHRILVGSAFAALLALATPASADEIKVDGEILQVAVPDGYCKLYREKPDEARWIDMLDSFRPDQFPIIHLMRCDMLELEHSKTFTLDSHVMIVSAKTRDGVVARTNVPRADFLRRMQNSIPPIDRDDVEHLLKHEFNQVPSWRASGLLEADDNAVYRGEMTGDHGTYLVAYTILRGMAIFVESLDYGLPSGFEPQLVMLRPFMAKLVEENP